MAPGPDLEGGERGLAGDSIEGAIDLLERRGHGLAVLIGDDDPVRSVDGWEGLARVSLLKSGEDQGRALETPGRAGQA